jgi:hypothetical protein
MKIHRTLSESLLPTKLFDLRVPGVLLGCRDSTKIPLGWPVSLISNSVCPIPTPLSSPRLPRARTLAYCENCIAAWGEADRKAL